MNERSPALKLICPIVVPYDGVVSVVAAPELASELPPQVMGFIHAIEESLEQADTESIAANKPR
jgi:hypothetical protein